MDECGLVIGKDKTLFDKGITSYLPNVDVVQRIDPVARLLDVLGDRVRDQFVHHLLQLRAGNVAGDDLAHLLAYRAHLREEKVYF